MSQLQQIIAAIDKSGLDRTQKLRLLEALLAIHDDEIIYQTIHRPFHKVIGLVYDDYCKQEG